MSDMTMEPVLDRSIAALLGLAIGDALGAPVEGCPRGSYPRMHDFASGGTHDLRAGEWTDDTAMAICLADSLLARDGVDERDLLGRFLRWYRLGENSSGGRAVGISEKTRRTLEIFERTGRLDAAREVENAGNGCIMRLAPVAIFYHRAPDAARSAAARQALTTHGADEAVAATRLLADMLVAALGTGDVAAAVAAGAAAAHPALASIARGDYRSKGRAAISSAPRALDTLEAALWCLCRADDFEAAVTEAVDLGGDTDTIAAVTGQLAGAVFGTASIPRRWIDGLQGAARLAGLARELHARAPDSRMSNL
jgi:ADP-ribosyl-[dinitrogen reductase] hydrolase